MLICFVVLPCEPFSCETGYWRLFWFYIYAHFMISLHFISMWSAYSYLHGLILSHFMVLILWNHLWYITADAVGSGFECLSSPWIRARSDWSVVLFSYYFSICCLVLPLVEEGVGFAVVLLDVYLFFQSSIVAGGTLGHHDTSPHLSRHAFLGIAALL